MISPTISSSSASSGSPIAPFLPSSMYLGRPIRIVIVTRSNYRIYGKSVKMSTEIRSHRIVIQSPMSFVGSYRRTMRFVGDHHGLDRAARILLAILLLIPWWIVIVAWYLIFGVLLIPYRLLRRGGRKRKQERLRHDELLAQVQAASIAPPPESPPGTALSPLD